MTEVAHSPLMPTYPPQPVTFVRGEGTSALGRRRASATSTSCPGSAVTALGHSPPGGRRAPSPTQARTLLHVSNLYGTEPGLERGAADPRPAARRRGSGLLLQLRRRGQRVRHQARPQVRRSRPPRRRQRLRLVPRPHAGHAARHRPARRSTSRSSRCPRASATLPWDDLDALDSGASIPSVARRAARAGAGRGRREPGDAEYFAWRAAAVRRARASC